MFFWAVRSMLGEKEGGYLAGFVVLYAWCMLAAGDPEYFCESCLDSCTCNS